MECLDFISFRGIGQDDARLRNERGGKQLLTNGLAPVFHLRRGEGVAPRGEFPSRLSLRSHGLSIRDLANRMAQRAHCAAGGKKVPRRPGLSRITWARIVQNTDPSRAVYRVAYVLLCLGGLAPIQVHSVSGWPGAGMLSH